MLTNKKDWHPKIWTKPMVDKRMRYYLSTYGWMKLCRLIYDKDIKKLKVVEVGCGTGIFTLPLSMIGVDVTLIDYNDDVLQVASNIRNLYNVKDYIINNDFLEAAHESWHNQFDIVISGGVIEHLEKWEQIEYLRFHRDLVKDDGFILIRTPNANSKIYNWLNYSDINHELLNRNELAKMAIDAGILHYYIYGDGWWLDDLKLYSRALLSRLSDSFLPFKKRLKQRLDSKRDFNFLDKNDIINNIKQSSNMKNFVMPEPYDSAVLNLVGWK